MSNVNELLRDHVTLEVDCLDRIYLNGYVPTLQTGGQLVNFLTKHLGNRIPSPALLGKRGAMFRQAVKDFAEENEIPMIKFQPGQRKDDVAAAYREKFSEAEGVVFIGVAQERAKSFRAQKKQKGP